MTVETVDKIFRGSDPRLLALQCLVIGCCFWLGNVEFWGLSLRNWSVTKLIISCNGLVKIVMPVVCCFEVVLRTLIL